MTRNKDGFSSACRCLLMILLICTQALLGFNQTSATSDDGTGEVIDFAVFRKACEASNDLKAVSIGESILARLELKYGGHPGFGAYRSKLNTAEFLAGQMKARLTRATKEKTLSIKDELHDKKKDDENIASRSVAPAKSFYKKSIELFSKPIRADELEDEEKTFLAQYYDLKLRILTSAIAQAGRALTITDPDFDGTHDYVLVLPLLHALDEKLINIDVLPRWMQLPEQLDILSDSCLLHFGLPFHAMMLAKQSAQMQTETFSEVDFYRAAAQKCWDSYSHMAADCLKKAILCAPNNDPNAIVTLEFELVQLWMDSRNYSLATGEARNIFETYPEHHQAGEAIWLYFYCLSRYRDTDRILVHIDRALSDKRCRAYESRLMYIKWFALRSKGKEPVRLMAVEHELLKRYGNDPIIAPVLLFQGTRLMAGGDYESAREPLARLVEKFPSTKAAAQAKRILERTK